jgi:hypothetical protein
VGTVAIGVLHGSPIVLSGGGYDGTVQIWDLRGNVLACVRVGSQIGDIAFAGLGTVVVACERGLLTLQFARSVAAPTDAPFLGFVAGGPSVPPF